MRLPHLALILCVAALAACSRTEAPPEPVRSVKLLTVQMGTLSAQQELAGEVRAQTEMRLGFRVGGKLVQRPVAVGSQVKPGQLLAQLDANDLALASQAAQAQVSAAATQRDLLGADLKRFTDLKDRGFVSGAEIERRQAQLDAADATLRQAKAQSAVQGHQADYTRLLASGAGVVVAVDAEVGQVVAAGTPVIRIAQDGPRDVVISVPEGQLSQWRLGMEAQVRLWTHQSAGDALRGNVREIAANADPSTRTFQIKLALPTQADAPLGSTAFVILSADQGGTGAVGAIKLPTSALVKGQSSEKSNSAVWVFDPVSSTVNLRAVHVAGADGHEAVISEGLVLGDEVVATGVHVLSPGQKVTRFVHAAK